MLTFLDDEKKPFANTKTGIAVNTVLGLPSAAAGVAKDIAQGVARSAGSAALSLAKPFGGVDVLSANDFPTSFGKQIAQKFFGDEPLKSVENRIANNEIDIKQNPYAKQLGLDKFALPLAFAGTLGTTALDLTPFGSLEKNATKQILKETTVEGSMKILKNLGADDTIIKQMAPIFASTKTEKEATKALSLLDNLMKTKSLAMGTEPKVAKSIVDVVDTVDNPLLNEAKKYKSAEEFVKAQGQSVFRGGDTTLDTSRGGGKGISVSNNKETAGLFTPPKGGIVDEAILPKTAKILKEGDIPKNLQTAYLEEAKVLADPNNFSSTLQKSVIEKQQAIIDYARKNGFDAVEFPFEQEIRVIKPNVLKTKSQLTDIWNKANSIEKPSVKKVSEYDPGYFGRKKIELPPELEIRKEVLDNSPFKSKDNRFLLDKEGRVRELGDIKNPALVRKIEDRMAQAGVNDPAEFSAGVEKYLKDKSSLDSDIKNYLKTRTEDTKVLKEVAQDVPALENKILSSEVDSLEKTAEQVRVQANRVNNSEPFSLAKSIESAQTPVKDKVHLLDYIRTPDRVLQKIGLGKEADFLRKQYDSYTKELPLNIKKITDWADSLPKDSNQRLFKWLDGQKIELSQKELEVAGEIKTWLSEWADRLNLPKDNRLANYITHIFDDQLITKEFDEDLAKIIRDQIPGSVYDPFLQKRLGKLGYVEDVWKALDAYVKRATRKVNLDPALEKIKDKAASFEESQWDYVKSYIDRVNMRPTKIDLLLDNGIRSVVGNKFGQRPTNYLSRVLRGATYKSALGLNISSAVKNLSQGVNTYAKLGEKYTMIGYAKLFSRGANDELLREGILGQDFIQDRTLSATKRTLQKVDDALFYFFDKAEKINRGSAYFGAKSKALAQGKSVEEAIEYAKKIVRDTQFTFGSIDTPIALQSDIGKTLGQFQSFTTKQVEFLGEMAKNKEIAGLIRYAGAGMLFVYTIGEAFGMEPKDLLPVWKVGTPPSLRVPAEIAKAALDAPDRYGKDRSIGKKIKDVGNAVVGLFPGSVQIKKTLKGLQNDPSLKSALFGTKLKKKPLNFLD